MELSEYTETLRREVASITKFAGEDVARAGQQIAEALDASIRLTLLDVLSGAAAPQARLPFELPRSMAAVEASFPDLPADTIDPLYPHGFGLSYNQPSLP